MNDTEMKIVIAGFGGQGVVLTGTILAQASMTEGKHVTTMVSYGAEMRGGTANSTVVVSSEPIASPVIEQPNAAIILNQPSLDKFEEKITEGGILVVNTSLTGREVKRKDLQVVKINATDIALELGNLRVTNVVALGAFVKKTGLVKKASIAEAIKQLLSKGKSGLIDINKTALETGFERCEF